MQHQVGMDLPMGGVSRMPLFTSESIAVKQGKIYCLYVTMTNGVDP